MKKVLYLGLILSVALAGCIRPPEYSVIPHIQFVSVSSNYVTNGQVDTLTFSFTDGDGDIGVNTTAADSNCPCIQPGNDSSCFKIDTKNIFLIDNRGPNSCITPYASANVQPTGKYKAISGNIEVIAVINTTKCITCSGGVCEGGGGGNGLDTVIYTIYLKDMAGHLSNAIQTSPITTGCQ